jgi:hypothetical protein
VIDPPGPPHDPEDPDEQEPPEGRIRPTTLGVWVPLALIGLVLGWVLKQVVERVSGVAPVVSWGQPAALWLVALVIGTTWWQTRAAVQVRRERLEPHRAVNRLVLARAGALVGALVGGGYAGYALSWVGDPAELATQRIVRSGIAVLAAITIVVFSLLLERACRVRKRDDTP